MQLCHLPSSTFTRDALPNGYMPPTRYITPNRHCRPLTLTSTPYALHYDYSQKSPYETGDPFRASAYFRASGSGLEVGTHHRPSQHLPSPTGFPYVPRPPKRKLSISNPPVPYKMLKPHSGALPNVLVRSQPSKPSPVLRHTCDKCKRCFRYPYELRNHQANERGCKTRVNHHTSSKKLASATRVARNMSSVSIPLFQFAVDQNEHSRSFQAPSGQQGQLFASNLSPDVGHVAVEVPVAECAPRKISLPGWTVMVFHDDEVEENEEERDELEQEEVLL